MPYDPLREASEIRDQLASVDRKLALLFGAGTSMAVGVPGIDDLTNHVSKQLRGPFKTQFVNIVKELPAKSNVESILDRIRLCCELFGDNEEKELFGVKGATAAKELDCAICQSICEVIRKYTPKKLGPYSIFAQWLQASRNRRDWPVEVFTMNYDLFLENAMENCGVPFFDGFVGSVAPFFVPESVEAEPAKEDESIYPPRSWTRLWKLHGSINWCLQKNTSGDRVRITRLSGSESRKGEKLVIFPSREKYAQSRKLPFLAFQDRLRNFLSRGECLLVVEGYSFSDEHINEVIFQALRSNPDLSVLVFMHSELSPKTIQYGEEHRNMTFYGRDKACIGGIAASWLEPSKKPKETEHWPFWNYKSKQFMLGDFNSFAAFLESFIGFRSALADSERSISTSKDINTQNKKDT
jgi:hypothetical protein